MFYAHLCMLNDSYAYTNCLSSLMPNIFECSDSQKKKKIPLSTLEEVDMDLSDSE
jgi:hypothetical protein